LLKSRAKNEEKKCLKFAEVPNKKNEGKKKSKEQTENINVAATMKGAIFKSPVFSVHESQLKLCNKETS